MHAASSWPHDSPTFNLIHGTSLCNLMMQYPINTLQIPHLATMHRSGCWMLCVINLIIKQHSLPCYRLQSKDRVDNSMLIRMMSLLLQLLIPEYLYDQQIINPYSNDCCSWALDTFIQKQLASMLLQFASGKFALKCKQKSTKFSANYDLPQSRLSTGSVPDLMGIHRLSSL